MRKVTLVFVLLLCSLPTFGQVIKYQEITGLPLDMTSGYQVAGTSIGSDGALWMFQMVGKSGTGFIYRSDGSSSATMAGYANGIISNQTSATWSNSTFTLSTVPSPQGKDGLFGYYSIATKTFVVLQAKNGVVTTRCSAYTVDGGKGVLPQYLARGPFPAYDGTYSLTSTTIKNTGTTTSPVYTTSSSLFELGTVVNPATSTCDLKTIVTVDKEIVQAVKQPGGKYLINQVTLPALGNSWLTRVGLLGTDGSYTDIISKDSTKFPATQCCFFQQDWGTANAVTSNAVITYFGKDGKGHAYTYVSGVLTEVFNSGVAGHLTADICVDAFHAGVALLCGSDSAYGGNDKLIAVNVASDTHQSVLVGDYNSFLNGTINYKFFRGMGSLDDVGNVYLMAYNNTDGTSHFFKASVPGITQMPVPVVDKFEVSSSTITAGDSAILTWATRNTTSVSILGLGADGGLGIVPTNGSMPVSPSSTWTYILTAIGPNGSAHAEVKVTVNQPAVPLPQISSNGVRNAASYDQSLSPGSFGSIFGQNFASSATSASASIPYPTSFSGVQVLVNGSPAPVQFVSTGQINFLVPFNTALGNASVQVVTNSVAGNIQTVPVGATSPGLFQYTSQGVSFGIVTDSNNKLITADNPYIRGQYGALWLTGLGKFDSACSPSSVEIPSTGACNSIANVTLTINGVSATVVYAGTTPGFPGLYQVNFMVPIDASQVPFTAKTVLGNLVAGDRQTSFNITMSQQ